MGVGATPPGRARRARLIPLAAAALLLPAAAAGAADPGLPGPYGTQLRTYRLAPLHVPAYRTPLEVEGDVALPMGAPGPRPLVMVLHGQHRTCLRRGGTPPGPSEATWPCPAGWTAVPSHRGYRWLTRMLASQGDVAVSISANSVNAQNNDTQAVGAVERALLLRHHLRLWSRWSTAGGDPWGGRVRGAVDPSRVVLVGHSRGGEGVAQAAAAATPSDPWRIRGLALIAPTAFGRQVTPGVDEMVLLPYCDGDVVDLEGQTYVDQRRDLTPEDGALRSAVLLLGANHNFFNTTWATDGAQPDDWTEDRIEGSGANERRTCGRGARGRLTGSAQRSAARTYVGALVRAAVDDDPGAIAVLEGTVATPASAGRVTALVSPWGGSARLLYAPRADRRAPRGARVAVRRCKGYSLTARGAASTCLSTASSERQPHWVQMGGGGPVPAPVALELTWRRSGGVVPVPLGAPADLSGRSAVSIRLALDPDAPVPRISLRLGDASGRTVVVPAVGTPLRRLPGPANGAGSLLPKIWAQTLRFPLDPAALDLAHLTRAALITGGRRGHAWLLDVAAVGASVGSSAAPALPSLRVGRVRVTERGDAGRTVVDVPVIIAGAVTRPARLAVNVADPTGHSRWRLVDLRAGATSLRIPVTVTADDLRTGPRTYAVSVVALREAVVARYDGSVTVQDDEPAPRVRVERGSVRAVEGEDLVWRLHLSRPATQPVLLSLVPVALPAGVPVIGTADVAPDLLEQWGVRPGAAPVPLAQTYASIDVMFEPGQTRAEARLRTVADDVREAPERVVWRVGGGGFGDTDPGVVPRRLLLSGTLRDR